MAFSDTPSSTTAAPPLPQQETQTLITLLGNLMPLLLQIQSQSLAQVSPLSPTGLTAPNPIIDHQAAVNFVEDMTADSLRTLSAFLEANAARYAGLETCVPIITQAIHYFAARDFGQAFNLIWQTYRVIAAVRATNPHLPPTRTAGPVTAPTGSSTTAVH